MRTRVLTGAITFLVGTAMVFGALYLDQIQGREADSIGLYQVVVALTGYMVLIGGIMFMIREKGLARIVRNILFIGGGVITFVSTFADYMNVEGAKGFDKFQMVGIGYGFILVMGGFVIYTLRRQASN